MSESIFGCRTPQKTKHQNYQHGSSRGFSYRSLSIYPHHIHESIYSQLNSTHTFNPKHTVYNSILQRVGFTNPQNLSHIHPRWDDCTLSQSKTCLYNSVRVLVPVWWRNCTVLCTARERWGFVAGFYMSIAVFPSDTRQWGWGKEKIPRTGRGKSLCARNWNRTHLFPRTFG